MLIDFPQQTLVGGPQAMNHTFEFSAEDANLVISITDTSRGWIFTRTDAHGAAGEGGKGLNDRMLQETQEYDQHRDGDQGVGDDGVFDYCQLLGSDLPGTEPQQQSGGTGNTRQNGVDLKVVLYRADIDRRTGIDLLKHLMRLLCHVHIAQGPHPKVNLGLVPQVFR